MRKEGLFKAAVFCVLLAGAQYLLEQERKKRISYTELDDYITELQAYHCVCEEQLGKANPAAARASLREFRSFFEDHFPKLKAKIQDSDTLHRLYKLHMQVLVCIQIQGKIPALDSQSIIRSLNPSIS